MAKPEDNPNKGKYTQLLEAWTPRIAGGFAIIGLIWGAFAEFDGTTYSIGRIVLLSGGMAFLGGLTWTIFSIIIGMALDSAANKENAFSQGASFVLYAFAFLALFDALLLRGSLIFLPSLSVLGLYDWEATYWGCTGEYVALEEGNFCDDD